MVTKTKSGNDGNSNNSININIEPPKRRAPRTSSPKSPKNAPKGNRVLKAIGGGIIAISAFIIIYYLLGLEGKEKTPENLPRTNPIEGTKQH